MKIIKAGDAAIETIVGEMLNIECGMILYTDGKLCEEPVAASKGYPKLIDGPLQYTIKASSGYIFLPHGTELSNFERKIQKQLVKQIVELKNHGVVPLKTPHNIKTSYHTNVKAVTSQTVTKDSTQTNVPRNGFNNIIRQFTIQDIDPRVARFTWHLRHINQFSHAIGSNAMELAIAQRLCSIFYDKYDVCTLGHNDTITDFKVSHFKNSSKIISCDVTLNEHGNPLTFELNSHWKTNYDLLPAFQKTFRNLTRNVYRIDYADIQLKPVKIASNVTSIDVCSKCRCLLWGENYALAEPHSDRHSPLCTALCSMCLHTSPNSKCIEGQYGRTFRVEFPRTVSQMLRDPNIDEQHRDILESAMTRVEKRRFNVDKRTKATYTVIGDKYASFENTNDFLYSNSPDHPDFVGRQILSAKYI